MASEVKWIKIVTDIFDDEKILLIESMPERDAIIVIWFKLLCLAGKQNNGGIFLLSEKIAYTDEMLSVVFRRPINTVRLALQTFEQFGMVEIVNNTITIPNWEKHQDLDRIQKGREQTRKRVAAYRERLKIAEKADESNDSERCNDDVTRYVTQVYENVTQIEREGEREGKGEREEIISAAKPQKHKHGEFKHVLLTDAEYQKLIADYGESVTSKYIKKVDEYCEQSGRRYKNYNLAIRNTFMARDNVKPETQADDDYDWSKLIPGYGG